ncbi:peroxiredoxin [Aestuariivirga litoralis]|uniref:Glutathione-dependent peroxiredoxin n=1 Tax=Aestuariivirga litoralis TaxID=2650924 RepID=A0A2W2B650_9HYPH|nr:peroxiredoxin [Aestuariivirga litoralis]PZF75794.1 peroxiredoxin [Aestuariivirga litoralis]
MTIQPGDKLPNVEFTVTTAEGPQKMLTDVLFSGRKVVLFGLPGAFTPTCSMNHLPGFLLAHDDIKAQGVDTIACTAVNDIHVMKAWSKDTGSEGKIMMLADGNAEFAKAAGLDLDLAVAGMGLRSRRYSMIVENGVVKTLNIETERGVNVSGAETIMQQLKG